MLGVAMGAHSAQISLDWHVTDDFDAQNAVSSMHQHPNVWSDGSLVFGSVTGAASAGSGMYVHVLGRAWVGRSSEAS